MANTMVPAPPTAPRPTAARPAGGGTMVVYDATATKPAPARRSQVLDRIKAEAAADSETLIGMAAAGGLGLLERYNVNYPHLPMMDKTATPAIVLYAAAKFTGSARLKAFARGAVHVATYRMAAGGEAPGVSGEGDEDLTAGRI